MAKLYLRDVGSHPERDLEVTLFPDGELQFEADNGKYVHINITREGVVVSRADGERMTDDEKSS